MVLYLGERRVLPRAFFVLSRGIVTRMHSLVVLQSKNLIGTGTDV